MTTRRRALVYVLALWLVTIAAMYAASPSPASIGFSTACSTDLDQGTCERADWIANALNDGALYNVQIQDVTNNLHGDLWSVVGAVVGAGAGVMLIRGLFGRG